MPTVYKLLRPNLTTHAGCQWVEGEEKQTSGEGGLCGPGWLHAYTHPLLAVLLNPIHANYAPAVMYEAHAHGKVAHDHGLKVGYTHMTLTRALPLPTITTDQRVRFAIYLALSRYREARFVRWAQDWVSSKDRTSAACALVAACAAAGDEVVATISSPAWDEAATLGRYARRDRHNARLIAAAPAMLAALEGMLEQEQNMAGECGWCFLSPFGQCERPTCPGVIARAAIAKARGKKEEA